MTFARVLEKAVPVLVAGFVLVFTTWSLARYRRYSPDSMNYVNVARNVLRGHGLTQDTVGFGGNYLRVDLPARDPLGTHPPFFPLVLAAVSLSGIPTVHAALLVPAVAYGFILWLGPLLVRRLYDARAGLVALLLLIASYPLALIARTAWAESLGLALTLAALALVIPRPDPALRARLFAAGACAGLAFAARYPLVIVCPLVLAALYEHGRPRESARRMLPVVVGFLLVFVPIVWRNVTLLGYWTGVSRNPSTLSLGHNVRAGADALFGRYFAPGTSRRHPWAATRYKERAQMAAFAAVAAAAAWRLRRRPDALRAIFGGQRWILAAAVGGYAAMLIVQRTLQTFDPIAERLMVPGHLFLMLAVAGVLAGAFPAPGLAALRAGVIALLLWKAVPLVRELRDGEYVSDTRLVRTSALHSWVYRATGPEDLVIADDGQKYPFYLDRPVLYLTGFPQMNFVTPGQMTELVRRACPRYSRIFLVLDRHHGWTEDDWSAVYGPFIKDVVMGTYQGEPPVALWKDLDDGLVFQVTCPVSSGA